MSAATRPARARRRMSAPRRRGDRRACADWAEHDAHRRPGRAAVEPSYRAWAAVSVGAAGVPGARQVPEGRRVLRRGGPPSGRRAPTSSWSTPTSTASTWPAAAPSCPSTTCVVIDEAHQLEDIGRDTVGARDRTAGRFHGLGAVARGASTSRDVVGAIAEARPGLRRGARRRRAVDRLGVPPPRRAGRRARRRTAAARRRVTRPPGDRRRRQAADVGRRQAAGAAGRAATAG